MSVTSQLDDLASPLAAFMAKRFINTRPFLTALNRELARTPLIEPPAVERYDYGLVGTALDFRLRMYFSRTATTKGYTVAELGADRALECAVQFAGADSETLEETSLATFARVAEVLAGAEVVGRRLSQSDEDQVNRACVVLALFEQCFRVRPRRDFAIVQALIAGQDAIFGLVRSEWLEDLRVLSWRFHETQAALLASTSFFLNPVFLGSIDVGGADGDLIVDGELIDITTSRQPLARAKLFEILAYALLDYEDQYGIRAASVYVARRGVRPAWSLEELMSTLSGERVDLGRERVALRFALAREVPKGTRSDMINEPPLRRRS